MKKTVLVSRLLTEEIRSELESMGYRTFDMEPSKNISSELKYHPDILTFRLPDGSWLFEKDYKPEGRFRKHKTEITLNDRYPRDCCFNCAKLGETLIYGNDFIFSHFGAMFRDSVKVRQGYVKCSTVMIGDGVITSDPSIYNALKKKGCDVLLVSNEGIQLNGFGCGFIGGACGVLGNKLIAFFGNIKRHKDYENIRAFAENYGMKLYSLSENVLYDYGGMFEL